MAIFIPGTDRIVVTHFVVVVLRVFLFCLLDVGESPKLRGFRQDPDEIWQRIVMHRLTELDFCCDVIGSIWRP